MVDLFWNHNGQGYLLSTFDVTGNGLSSDRYNIIDTIHAIFPKQGLTETDTGFTLFTPGVLAGFVTPNVEFATPGPVKLLKQSPNRTWIAAVTRVPDLRRYCLYAIDPLVGEPIAIADIVNPKAMAFGRRGELNVLDGNVIKQFDLNAEEPLLATIALPSELPGDDIFCDDATDEVVVLSSNPRMLYRFPRQLNGEGRADSFPFFGEEEGEFMGAINPADGSVYIGVRGGRQVRQLQRNPLNNRYEYGQMYGGPDAEPVSDMAFDDRGHVFFARGGEIVEMLVDDEGTPREVEGLFTGLPAGNLLQISRSRTNMDDEMMELPGWNTNTPLEEIRISDEIVDCDADFNEDGLGDIRDLLEYLVAWFDSDPIANRDGNPIIDIRDLLEFLTAWFAGCPEA